MNTLTIISRIVPIFLTVAVIGLYTTTTYALTFMQDAIRDCPSAFHKKKNRTFIENNLRYAEYMLSVNGRWICFVPILHLYLFICAYFLWEILYCCVTVKAEGDITLKDIRCVLPNADSATFKKIAFCTENEKILKEGAFETHYIKKYIKKLFKKWGYDKKPNFIPGANITRTVYQDIFRVDIPNGKLVFFAYHSQIMYRKETKNLIRQWIDFENRQLRCGKGYDEEDLAKRRENLKIRKSFSDAESEE